ncbi:MAG: ribbon-helix-helix protein, CopG family [Rudaea sp.]|nr:ribbon-helix-helix protein, CopG family [Rudaea sp.]
MNNVSPLMVRRPKQNKMVAMRLDRTLIDRLDREAASQRRTRTELVRQLLLGYLARQSGLRQEKAA